jgi:hypothetical protein
MKSIKYIIILAVAFAFQFSYSQGCEGPGEGDGIKIFGFIQPQYEYAITGMNKERTPDLDQSGFFFNRARLGVMGNIPYDFSYYFIMEYAPAGGFGVCDAYISYERYKPFLTAAVGQFKTPFGAEQMQGCHKLYTIDRSDVTNELAGPIRDLGFMISGSTGEKIKISEGVKDVFTYQLAMMNGEGRDVMGDDYEFHSLSDNLKTYVARLTFSPSKYFTLGGSYKTGKFTPESATATEDDARVRLGFDATIKYKKFILQGEYISGTDKGSYTTGGGCGGTVSVVDGSTERSGYYLTALYRIKDKFEPVFKYESNGIDKLNDVVVDNSHTLRWTAGFNYHFNEWTRLQVNYQYNTKEAKYLPTQAYQDVLQIQLQAIIK